MALSIINVVIPNLLQSAFYFASRDFLSSFASFSAYVQEHLLPPYCNLSLPTENLVSKSSLRVWFHIRYKFPA